MTFTRLARYLACGAAFAVSAAAADYPAPKTGEWIVKDFRFHSGVVRQL